MNLDSKTKRSVTAANRLWSRIHVHVCGSCKQLDSNTSSGDACNVSYDPATSERIAREPTAPDHFEASLVRIISILCKEI